MVQDQSPVQAGMARGQGLPHHPAGCEDHTVHTEMLLPWNPGVCNRSQPRGAPLTDVNGVLAETHQPNLPPHLLSLHSAFLFQLSQGL